MADLTKCRLQQVKPFITTGVHYAGPILLKCSTTCRSSPPQAYIFLFVCMATKPLHLDLASDLSSETFLMAFCRFLSRRGPVGNMHSDCETNIVGATKLFQPVDAFVISEYYQEKFETYLSARNISWHFNPPSAPHFGELWEVGVKSMKTLLFRTLGPQRLTYEEFNTLLTHIKSNLNFQRSSALSSDPFDFEALTASHFQH